MEREYKPENIKRTFELVFYFFKVYKADPIDPPPSPGAYGIKIFLNNFDNSIAEEPII